MSPLRKNSLAGIQYGGLGGVSRSCIDAVRRYIQFGDRIERVKILSAGQAHCLVLELHPDETIAIKSGFASGYPGEGPRTFADVLALLEAHGAEIDEFRVPDALIQRLDDSALTLKDLDFIESLEPVRPYRWYDYVYDIYSEDRNESWVWGRFPEIMPWAIIDSRLIDLAKQYFEDPDRCILTGFRRLEDIIRKRLASEEHSTKLFSLAFISEKSYLTWDDIESGEQTGRANLFVGAYMAFRNPRAHKELREGPRALAEFLVLNELFILESTAIDRSIETETVGE